MNSTVDLGSMHNWYIYVKNHVGGEQKISVRVKLLNSTMALPNDQEHQPCPVTPLADFPVSLTDNETTLIPFSWSITKSETQNNSLSINRIMVNENTYDVQVSGPSNSAFNLVFELWVQDQHSQEYLFGWESSKGFSSASLNMGFKLKASNNKSLT